MSILLVTLLITSCRSAPTPRQSKLPAIAETRETAGDPSPKSLSMLHTLLPEAGARPATLKDNDYHRVSGDYAYVDLEAVLKLIGRLPSHEPPVTKIRFFERIAASVMVGEWGPTEYFCTKYEDGAWHIVGMRMWSH